MIIRIEISVCTCSTLLPPFTKQASLRRTRTRVRTVAITTILTTAAEEVVAKELNLLTFCIPDCQAKYVEKQCERKTKYYHRHISI